MSDILITGEQYSNQLDNNDEFSLAIRTDIDFTEDEREFIKLFVSYGDLLTTFKLMNSRGFFQDLIDDKIAEMTEEEREKNQGHVSLDMYEALGRYMASPKVQAEITRLEKALNQRRFATKLMTFDEIGNYLTSMIKDENVPIGKRLSSNSKLNAVKMLMDWYEQKNEILGDNASNEIIDASLDEQLHELSVDSIKMLLETSEKKKIDGKDLENIPNNELIDMLNSKTKETKQEKDTKKEKKTKKTKKV